MPGVDEVVALAADAKVELAATEGVTGPAVVVPVTGVSVVEETDRRDVEEVEMSGSETAVDGAVTLAAVEGAADSVRVTLAEEGGDKEDIGDPEVDVFFVLTPDSEVEEVLTSSAVML